MIIIYFVVFVNDEPLYHPSPLTRWLAGNTLMIISGEVVHAGDHPCLPQAGVG